MSQLIISFRRDSSHAAAGRLYDYLTDHFGASVVQFGAAELARPGGDRVESISTAVADAGGLIVAIGPDWLAGDWLEDETDPDRVALEVALRENKTVLPVLLDDAELPTSDLLPVSVRGLTRRTPIVIDNDRFRDDAGRIASTFSELMPADPYGQSMWPDGEVPQTWPPRKKHEPAGAESGYVHPVDDTSGPLFVNALLYPFRTDERWFAKVAIAVLVSLIPFIGGVIALGYNVRLARRIRARQSGLPEWDDWGGDFGRGLVTVIGILIPVVFFVIALVIMVAIISAMFPSNETTIVNDRVVEESISDAGAIIVLFVTVMLAYPFAIMVTTAQALYVDTNQFAAFTDFGAQWREFNRSHWRNLAFLGHSILFGLIVGVMAWIGLLLLAIPGLFVLGAAGMSQYYLVAYWLETIRPVNPNN
jgi:hypothetical protein